MENAYYKESLREEKLKQMFLAIGVKNKAAYTQYIQRNKSNQLVDASMNMR
jgi:hypothetical protein